MTNHDIYGRAHFLWHLSCYSWLFMTIHICGHPHQCISMNPLYTNRNIISHSWIIPFGKKSGEIIQRMIIRQRRVSHPDPFPKWLGLLVHSKLAWFIWPHQAHFMAVCSLNKLQSYIKWKSPQKPLTFARLRLPYFHFSMKVLHCYQRNFGLKFLPLLG